MTHSQASERVLIIDDDAMVGRMGVAHAIASGHEARSTDDPDEFMEICRAWDPTFVIVDLVMPRADGLEILRRLATIGSRASVIIASGQDSRVLDAARRFADANNLVFAGILAKPYRRAELSSLLAHHPAQSGDETAVGADAEDPWTAPEFEDAFRESVATGEITVAFQPKVSCADGHVVGYEALARWVHSERGPIDTSSFVAQAERGGLVGLLTDTVFRQALGWFGAHRHRAGKRLALNISPAELSAPDLDERLLRACRDAGVSTEQVIIELTETSAMDDPVLSLQFLTRLRLQGFHLSLDDFGTGYSSMLQLARLPFSEIKVDQSFVINAATSKESQIVIRSIVELGHALGLESTAEGVEDGDVLSFLKDLGCDHAQGYHIARPMPADELDIWLESAPH